MRPLTLASLAVAVATMLATPTAAQVPARDSVVASGNAGSFSSIDTNATSGPSGEQPTGHAVAEAFGIAGRFRSATITCLSVIGNTAIVAGSLEPNSIGFAGFIQVLVDNGPADSGLDTFVASGTFTVPTECSSPLLGAPLTDGDIVVVDAPPLPVSKDQCKNGGWRNFGSVFKNQGDCVSFVATKGENPPANSP